jgi:aryl-alcohol dehydrogenase-like predicted oxidoreductase
VVAGTVKELIQEGKVKHFGLFEASAQTISLICHFFQFLSQAFNFIRIIERHYHSVMPT